ncbi:hypothetical protein AA984_21225 [Brevibacillus formosus]|uniref:Uncharacterized protein n=1 Tax=Brevibacillus formosus TaxID=54913 RepID=A0A837KH58_9BACL|nr:hypothetical protein AA984_21225 [Brevibacillus formosus]PSJ93931.1 hypothetical protein C7R91_18065 [Brevibacillus formosus]
MSLSLLIITTFGLPISIKVKKSAFQHRENGENLKKEERSVGDLHEHRTSKVNASFDAESTFINDFVIKSQLFDYLFNKSQKVGFSAPRKWQEPEEGGAECRGPT